MGREGGISGGCSQNLMLSSNLVKSKIPIYGGVGVWRGGWGVGVRAGEFPTESKFALKKNFLQNIF